MYSNFDVLRKRVSALFKFFNNMHILNYSYQDNTEIVYFVINKM